jgi:hypothetical protein
MIQMKLKVPLRKSEEQGWKETLVRRINEGKVLPVVGNALCDDLIFGSHAGLLDIWAQVIEYPLPGRRVLPRMAQYEHVRRKAQPGGDDRAVRESYLEFVNDMLDQVADPKLLAEARDDVNYSRFTFSQKAQRLHRPNFADGMENPLLLLAQLDLPIFVTTSYHDCLEMALTHAGKTPHPEICYWDRRLLAIPSVLGNPAYEPSIHGRDQYTDSLVITEDDHLDFLVAIAESKSVAVTNSAVARQADVAKPAIPLRVRQALADSSLLLLGYSVYDWDFRSLFRGVIRPSTTSNSPKSVALQLDVDERQRSYVTNYLLHEARFEVEWTAPLPFMQEIYHLWASR